MMSVVSGRVRGTVQLRQDEVGAACVLATSWSSERAFPRTVGVGVTFEIETDGGQILRVDPFDAVVALPVRRYDRRVGVSREYAWIGPDDEVTVEGDFVAGDPDPSQPPCLRATRIAAAAAGCARHHVPPRSLRTGQAAERTTAGASPEADGAPAPGGPSSGPGDPQPLPRRRRKPAG